MQPSVWIHLNLILNSRFTLATRHQLGFLLPKLVSESEFGRAATPRGSAKSIPAAHGGNRRKPDVVRLRSTQAALLSTDRDQFIAIDTHLNRGYPA